MSADSEKAQEIAYQVAADLYMNENSLVWSRFNIMVAVNALIVAGAQVVAQAAEKHNLILLAFSLPLLGMIFCGIWWKMMARGFDYHDHWREWAERTEAAVYGKDSRGKVCAPITCATKRFRMGEPEGKPQCESIHECQNLRKQERAGQRRTGTARRHSYILIALFFVLYVFTCAQLVMHFFCGKGIYCLEL
jgi:hypothetical protein